jgi:aminoglycoside phosphotransferase (APT) family kinase protein
LEHIEIIEQYFSAIIELEIQPIENGWINNTFVIVNKIEEKRYILQKINSTIFKNPEAIVHNQIAVHKELAANNYPHPIAGLIHNLEGKYLSYDSLGQVWRMMYFVEDSKTILKVPNPETAQKAANAFGEFYLYLNKNSIEIQEVLPGFIDFEKRMNDFETALKNTTNTVLENAKNCIDFIQSQQKLPQKWIFLHQNKKLPVRIVHADPKISNILLDKDNNPLCIIDWDTIMKASILYDFGDMVRSYTNKEEEDGAENPQNFDAEIYKAIKKGFLQPLTNFLTPIELENMDYAAQVIIYIQAVRFLTDYLNGNLYYSTKYEGQNLDRTKNQIFLLKGLQAFLPNNTPIGYL